MTTVELGSRRRWVLAAGAAVVVWIVVAVVVGSGGGGDDGRASPDTTVPPSTSTTSSTTTTSVVEGGPSLDVPEGWELVVTGRQPGVRAIDLRTGAVRDLPFSFLRAARPDGVFSVDAVGLQWRPWPMDDASAVRLDAGDGQVFSVPGSDRAWVWQPGGGAALVSLTDGAQLRFVAVPPNATVLGAAPSGLVLSAGGDTLVVGEDGSTLTIDGLSWFVSEDTALVHRCAPSAEAIVCQPGVFSLEDGAGVGAIADVSVGRVRSVDAVHPAGWPTVRLPGDPAGYVVLRPDGWAPVLPDGIPTSSGTVAWTPDGRQLLVRAANVVHVVEAFADGGPAEVDAFLVAGAVSTMHVVGPPAP